MRTADQQRRKAEAMLRDAEAAEEKAAKLRSLAATAAAEVDELEQRENRINDLVSCAVEDRHLDHEERPILIRDQGGDWCQLEQHGEVVYRGHLSDLDAETFADKVGIDLVILEGTILEDGRSFA